MGNFKATQGWGPDRKQSALAITFDNLGEAAEVENGTWNGPIGQHHTAAFIPKLIETLGDVRTTYFIEASNTEIYPDAIKLWHDAGHEVGVHGWRHENWANTESGHRRDTLRRSMTAMRSMGVDPVGFRPPGGEVEGDTYAELEEAGFRYCSDVGSSGVQRFGGLLSIPFEWPNVDAYNLEEISKPRRRRRGDPEEAGTIDQWKDALARSLEQAIAQGGLSVVLFHPDFIGASDEKLSVVNWLIDRAQRAGMWVAPLGDIAAFVEQELPSVPQMA